MIRLCVLFPPCLLLLLSLPLKAAAQPLHVDFVKTVGDPTLVAEDDPIVGPFGRFDTNQKQPSSRSCGSATASPSSPSPRAPTSSARSRPTVSCR